jgi:hypothetical protein
VPRVADRKDEQSVLGNLPRARPGQRSSKRGGGASTKRAAAASGSPATRAKAARAKTTARRKPAAKRAAEPKVAATSAPPKTTIEPERDSGGTDPVTGAVQLAGKVAGLGLKTAGALLRRLPGR